MSSLQLPGWLHCNKCHVFASNSYISNNTGQNTTDIRLYILECTHIVCKRCISMSAHSQATQHQQRRININVPCPLCATICAAKCIGNDALPAEVQPFLDENMVLSELDRLRYCVQFQLNNQNEAIQFLQAKLNKQSKLLRQARSYIEHMQRGQQQQAQQLPKQTFEWHPRMAPSDSQRPLRMRSTEYRQTQSKEPVPRGSHIRFPYQSNQQQMSGQISPVYIRASSVLNSSNQQKQQQQLNISRLGVMRRPLYSPLLAPPQATSHFH